MLRGLAICRGDGFGALGERRDQARHVAIAARGAETATDVGWCRGNPASTICPSRQRFTFVVNCAIEPFRFSIGLVVGNVWLSAPPRRPQKGAPWMDCAPSSTSLALGCGVGRQTFGSSLASCRARSAARE